MAKSDARPLDELPIENGCSQLHALFSETNGRYLVELAAEDVDAVSAILGQTPHAVIGRIGGDEVVITGRQLETEYQISVKALRAAHLQPVLN